MLGIPTVMDRLIQQAVLQRIDPIFDATFSEFSYGFRPRRSAHQAVLQAKVYIQEGHAWVVDMDIEKFFDHVQHDILMSRVSRRIGQANPTTDRPLPSSGRDGGRSRNHQ